MKVAFINELYGTKRQGGEQEAMFALARRLAGIPGYKADTFSYTGKDSKKIDLNISGYKKITPYVREIWAAPKLGKYVTKYICPDYDLIHTSSTTLFAKTKCPIPYIISLHGIRSQKADFLSAVGKYRLLFNPWIKNKLKNLEINGLADAFKIVALRDRQANFIKDNLKIDSAKIEIIPNPVDIALFTPKFTPSQKVLFVGRGTVPKGLDVLIKAAPQINGQIVVVTKVCDNNLLARGKTAGLVFRFDVAHDDMPAVYNEANLFVLPSLDEEMPLTILEAKAAGLPVVATKIGAANLIQNQKGGLIIPTQDPKALAQAINQLLEDSNKAEQYGQYNRQQVENYHAWKMVIKKYLAIYGEVLNH